MSEIIEFIEAEAKANAAFHIANGDALTRESNTMLNILLAGAGGSIAYAVKLSESERWQQYGMASVAIYLALVAAILLYKCLKIDPIWPPANEPKNFPLTGFTLEAIKEAELRNRQACIEQNRLRNERVGKWLNCCRMLAAATPIAFAIGAGLAFWVGS